ncbi:MAG: hypothetical protein ACI4PQ_01890 [Butyricicoccaceae bacterium]
MFDHKKRNEQEEDIIIYDENDSIARSRQKSRRIFVFYIIALFSVALVIILASYVVQAHQQEQLAAMGNRLSKQQSATEGAKNRAQEMQEQMEVLQKQVDELQDQLEEAEEQQKKNESELKALNSELKAEKENARALNLLWKLEEAYTEGDYDRAEDLVDQMDSNYGRSKLVDKDEKPLTNAAAAEYQDICNALGV